GGIAISDSGHVLGRGEGSFEYRVETRHRSMRGKARSAEGGGADMEGVDAALLATLKTLRLRLAKERQVPAYVVFSDRTLIDMADRRPRDLDAFAEVNGVGEAKLREFGEVFLEAIAGHRAV
ncbi:MAG: ATP-dependent DNA helicase RecQ, partial [Mesorhizobium sp.]